MRSATGLKSTEKVAPFGRASVSWLFLSHLPVLTSMVTMAPSGVTP
jgi:hypothetical protein